MVPSTIGAANEHNGCLKSGKTAEDSAEEMTGITEMVSPFVPN